MLSVIHAFTLCSWEKGEREKGRKAALFHSELISGFQNALLLQPTNPSTPQCWGSLISKGAQTHKSTHTIAFFNPNIFLLANAHSHTCMPVRAHVTMRPSINKHESNEKQHNTLQLGHFKHVQEKLGTLIQQPSTGRANSCLPYPTKVPCRQKRHGSAILSLKVGRSNQTQQGLLHSVADVEKDSRSYKVKEEKGDSEADMKYCLDFQV